jgi:RHS repeat-associated protein
LAFTYDTCYLGRLCTVTDWTGRVVTYTYDVSGRLLTATDRMSPADVTTSAYDGTSPRLTSITDANSHVAVTMTYDATTHKVLNQQDASGLTTGQQTTFGYGAPDGQGNVTTTITYPISSLDGFAPQQIDTYNSQGQTTQHVSKPSAAETLTETYQYTSQGFRSQVTDARGNISSFCYDTGYAGTLVTGSNGNLTRAISPPPLGGVNSLVTLVKYDTKNNVIESIAPKGVNNGSGVTCATNLSGAINGGGLFITDLAYDATLGTELLSATRKYTDPDLGGQTAVTKFAYGDGANPGLVTRVIPPRGNTGSSPDYTFAASLAYAASGSQAGMLLSVTDPLSNRTTYAYDSMGRRTSMTDPLSDAWTFTYDSEDRLTQATAPAPVTGGASLSTSAAFDAVGNRLSLTDANGQITRYQYDVRDSLKEVDQSATVTDPSGDPGKIATAYQYDNLGDLVRVDRATGASSEAVVDYAYDGLNRVRKETQYPQAGWPSAPNGSTGSQTLITQTTYDPNGNRATLTDPLGQVTAFGYDAVNRLTSVAYSNAAPGTSATANVSYVYDANGGRSSTGDGTGTTTYGYDELDRLLSVTSPGPKTVEYRYDLDGNRRKLIYPDTTAVSYTFDKGSRLQSLLDWATHTTSYTYFADGLLNTATNVNSTTARFTYDNARRLTQVWNQKGSSTIGQHTYTLDNAGNRTAVAEQLPQLTTPTPMLYAADSFARSATGSWGSADIGGAYWLAPPTTDYNVNGTAGAITTDANGEELRALLSNVSVRDVNGVVRVSADKAPTADQFAYLELRRIDLINTYQLQLRLATDGHAYVRLRAVVGGAVTQLTPEQQVAGFTSGPGAQVWLRAQVNGASPTTLSMKAWTNGQPEPAAWQATATDSTTALQSAAAVALKTYMIGATNLPVAFSFDNLSVANVATSSGTLPLTTNYTNDKLYRLTGAGTNSYSYDPVGNRPSLTRAGTATQYSYDKADRILSAGSTSYTVNAGGNETARGSDSFGYDQANRLTSASVGGVTSSYHYDGDGKRTSKTVGTTTTNYVYDVGDGLPVVLDDGARKYVYGAGLAYSIDKTSAAVQVYHTDGLGSVPAISDSTGSVVQTYQTDEFGVPAMTQGSGSQPFAYVGEQRDPENGLIYLRARMFDPAVGRFLQRDSRYGTLYDSQSLNRHSYVRNNPLRFTDRTGLTPSESGEACPDCASEVGLLNGSPADYAFLILTALVPAGPGDDVVLVDGVDAAEGAVTSLVKWDPDFAAKQILGGNNSQRVAERSHGMRPTG